jgi:hypothetical protein
VLIVPGLQKAAYLAEFAFKCERNPAGQTNYDWGYWFWILKVPTVCRQLACNCVLSNVHLICLLPGRQCT